MRAVKEYLLKVLDRAVKSAAQGALLAVGSESLAANAWTFDWSTIGGFAVGGFVLSVVTSLATTGLGRRKDDPQVIG